MATFAAWWRGFRAWERFVLIAGGALILAGGADALAHGQASGLGYDARVLIAVALDLYLFVAIRGMFDRAMREAKR